jgi:acetyl-CoA synthetase
MSGTSLKEKLSAQLTAAPPASLSEGALFPDEGRWAEFLATCAGDPDTFFWRIAEGFRWEARPASLGGAGDWFPEGKLNLAEICLGAGDPAAPCVLWRGEGDDIRSVSRAELTVRVADLVGRVRALDLASGDRIGVVVGTRPGLAVSMLACFAGGFTAVPIRENASSEAIASRLASVSCRAMITTSPNIEIPGADIPRIALRIDAPVQASATIDFAAVTAMHPALVLSDATGQLFAIPSAGFAVQAIAAYRYILDGRPGAPLWLLAPPTHAATAAALVGALASGGVVGLTRGSATHEIVDVIEQLATLPGRAALIDSDTAFALGTKIDGRPAGSQAPKGSLELIVVEGTSLEPRSLKCIRDELFDRPVHVVQALSRPECGGFLAGPYPPVTGIRFSSVSRPAPGLTLEIIDSQGRPCPVGVGGMLALARIPPAVALELQDAHTPAAIEVKARRDRDGNIWPLGEAHVALARSSGAKAAEIEAILAAIPGVEQVAVVRFTGQDGRASSRAFVKPAAGIEIRFEELQAALAASLGTGSTPDSFSIVDELPYTRSGKLLRSVLRRVCTGEPLSDEDLAMIKDPVVAETLARKVE